MRLEHDPEVDAVYVYLTDQSHPHAAVTRELDDARMIDLAADGSVIGVEFLYVSHGVDLTGIPQAARIAPLLRQHGIAVALPVA